MDTTAVLIVCLTVLALALIAAYTVVLVKASHDGYGRVIVPRAGSRVQVTKLDGQALRGSVVITDDDTLLLEQVDVVQEDGKITATGGRWLVPRARIEAVQEL